VILWGGLRKQFPALFSMLLILSFLLALVPLKEEMLGLQFSGANIKLFVFGLGCMAIMDGNDGGVWFW
jgi:hypothetical protein